MSAAATPEVVRIECPLCKNTSLKKHCERRQCTWADCNNLACLAMLDVKKGIGHHLDPDKGKDSKTGGTRRLRLIRRAKKWVHRLDGP